DDAPPRGPRRRALDPHLGVRPERAKHDERDAAGVRAARADDSAEPRRRRGDVRNGAASGRDAVVHRDVRYARVGVHAARAAGVFDAQTEAAAARRGAARDCCGVKCGWVRLGTTRYDWVRPGTTGYDQVRLGTTRYDWVRPGTTRYVKGQPATARA